MGLCSKNYITIGRGDKQRKVYTKGKTLEEIDREVANIKLELSDYRSDDHKKTIPDLEHEMRDELSQKMHEGKHPFKHGSYSFDRGMTHHDREIVTEGFTKLNRLTPSKQKPEWLKFLEEMGGFFSLLLWGGGILCFIGYGLRGEADNLYLGIVLFAVVFITGCFSYSQGAKSESLMSEFSKLADKKKTICLSDHELDERGNWVQVSDLKGKQTTFVDDYDPVFLARGDIVRLTSGQNVPADIRIISSQKFKVDNSPLTGEPDALPRNEKECFHDDPKESTNLVFYGTNVKEGEAIGVVLRVGDDTFIGKIAALTEDTATAKTPIAKEIDHFVMIVSGVAIFLGVLFFFIGVGLGTDLITNLVFVIGIIVANVPEGLLATVTVALTLTSRAMASKNVLVKNMEGVETLGSTTCICSDKTGTLTQNRMTCAELLYDCDIHRTPFVDASPGESTPAADMNSPTFQIFHEAMCMNTTATFRASQVRGTRNKATKQIDPTTRVPFYSIRKGESVPVVQWDTVGDASETSIVKLAQYTHPDAHRDSPIDTKLGILNRHNQDLVDARRSDYPLEDKIPFNSTNKYHVVIRKFPGDDPSRRFTIYMKGAPERILVRCDSLIMNGEVQRMNQSVRTRIESLQKSLMRKGRRVLAFAYQYIGDDILPEAREVTVDKKDEAGNVVGSETKTVYFDTQEVNFPMGEYRREVDGQVIEPPTEASKKPLVFIGMTALIDPPRPSVPDAVKSCLEAGIRVVMVTGDHPETAAAIARMVNIFTSDFKFMAPLRDTGKDPLREKFTTRGIVVAGSQFSPDTTDEKWKFIFSHEEIVFARTSPQQKLQIVQRFQQMEQEIVAVTGDGVNDAPALKKADIGVAMGIAGTDVSKTAADMILMDDNFASIVRGVEEGRLIFDNLKKSIAYTLSSNIPEIGPFLVFITVQVPLPLSTVLILCIDLGTDLVPAISMAWENPESDIMKRPPRDSSTDRLVTKKLVSFAYLQIGIIQAIAGFFTWIVVMNDYGYPPHVLPGLGSFDNWGKQVLWCQVEGGVMRDLQGNASPSLQFQQLALEGKYIFWDELEDGIVQQCTYAAKNLKGSATDLDYRDYLQPNYPGDFTGNSEVTTDLSIEAMVESGYIPFIPWKAYVSPFWENDWIAYDILESGVPGAGEDVDPTLFFNVQNPGLWTPDLSSVDPDGSAAATSESEIVLGSSDLYTSGTFELPPKDGSWYYDPAQDMFVADSSVDDETRARYQLMFAAFNEAGTKLYMNVASRMCQKEALHHAQCSYFVSIVIVQWADLLICKTRWLSIRHQGMRNSVMNFGLVFETILAAVLCYTPGLGDALGTRDIRFLHWVPAVPFSLIIFSYDEVRKYIMRSTSIPKRQGRQLIMEYGWLARNTYY